LCLVYRFVPGGWLVGTKFSMMDVIADGLSLSTIISDIVLAKMAKRELSSWIVIMSMLSVISNFSTIALAVFYYGKVLNEISTYTHLHILSVTRLVLASRTRFCEL
jgi:hypothetical protein